MVFQLQSRLKIFHHAQYLQPHNIPHAPNDSPPLPQKKEHITSFSYFGTTRWTGHEILRARTVGDCWNTLLYNLITNIKNQAFNFKCGNLNTKGTKLQHRTKKHSAIFLHFGNFQFSEWYKVKTIIWYTPSHSISWLPSDWRTSANIYEIIW